ncbi:MAG: GNAT family N-acetyltransferase [Rickettsiaceae bacterium]|nr:GNAT family N-acetyltransferase [Rickettsiaceae bacterium]
MSALLKPELVPATLDDYPMIQNMARFYVYEMSKYCGVHYPGWECPENGLFECDDFKHYFENPNNKTYLIKVDNEIAGFALINKLEVLSETDFNMGEFFILAKFQGSEIGRKIAKEIFNRHKGVWSVGAIPKNTKALQFWRSVINEYTESNFTEEAKTSDDLKTVEHPDPFPMIILTFDSNNHKDKVLQIIKIDLATLHDIPFMIELSDKKRTAYATAQPRFWRKSADANIKQSSFFQELLLKDDYILLTAKDYGFIIGNLIKAPEVYDPGGLTLMIDDFCVKTPDLWLTVGRALINEIKKIAKSKGAIQILVVCGAHDHGKHSFLKNMNLICASEWYVGEISDK